MKLLNRFRGHHLVEEVIASLFSTNAKSSLASYDVFFEKIQRIRDPAASIVPVVDQWIDDGGAIAKFQVRKLVQFMKDFRRYKHALKANPWRAEEQTDQKVQKLKETTTHDTIQKLE
ncbi:hypothetical protein Nepgr_014447 [Nepenthes gracilis]|uniref:Uncharacterized protein n=1 Tax=Nepenthes gracilis TaxID=150966 RepID=A0AAD3SL73_NEPGR|nr:hypothetical protein Nepgr_014447 [Nepenthes gracilis]